MEDIKELKSCISSMNTSIGELREMMMNFMQVNKPHIPPTTTPEVGTPVVHDTSLGAPSEAETTEVEGGGGETLPKKDANGTGVYSEVAPPPVYSPDPPIPHPRVNQQGDPPKLTPNAFFCGKLR
jgi:hypothetical protein